MRHGIQNFAARKQFHPLTLSAITPYVTNIRRTPSTRNGGLHTVLSFTQLLRIAVLLPFTAVFSHNSSSTAQEPLIIDNNPDRPIAARIEALLASVMPVTNLAEWNAQDLPKVSLTRSLLVNAAKAIPELRDDILNIESTRPLDWADFYSLASKPEYREKYLFGGSPYYSATGWNIVPIESQFETPMAFKTWSPVVLMNMISNNIIDTEKVSAKLVSGQLVEYVNFNEKYAASVKDIVYTQAALRHQTNVFAIGYSFGEMKAKLRQNSAIEQAMLFNIGRISFGEVVVYTAQEAEFRIPSSIQAEYDVYALELVH